jgi:predicted NAD/FAD-binding protein
VFEANDTVGGHTNTVEVADARGTLGVDTGFIVYNEATYPHFTRLLAALGVATQASEMSFGVRCDRSGLEYAGTNPNALFAQRRNLVNGAFLRMVADIVRFNRQARRYLHHPSGDDTMTDFLTALGVSRAFQDYYILPMAAAIWSADPAAIGEFPARTFLRFFDNHRLLQVSGQHTWRTIVGGSRRYVEAITAPFGERIRLRSPIRGITRHETHVDVQPVHGPVERFDQVIIAAHSDQALAMLRDASPEEQAVLGAIAYQRNDAVLHTDEALLPRSRRAWASWNYRIPAADTAGVTLTYDQNRLQRLQADTRYLLSLNQQEPIDPARVLREFTYHHPVFNGAALAAQARHGEISGRRRTHYCGAYWGYGFHEDGVNSALRVAEAFGMSPEWAR